MYKKIVHYYEFNVYLNLEFAIMILCLHFSVRYLIVFSIIILQVYLHSEYNDIYNIILSGSYATKGLKFYIVISIFHCYHFI